MQACVIYRDGDDGPKLTEVSDFVDRQGLDAMTSFLGGVRATGGADECESIASGLKIPVIGRNNRHRDQSCMNVVTCIRMCRHVHVRICIACCYLLVDMGM